MRLQKGEFISGERQISLRRPIQFIIYLNRNKEKKTFGVHFVAIFFSFGFFVRRY